MGALVRLGTTQKQACAKVERAYDMLIAASLEITDQSVLLTALRGDLGWTAWAPCKSTAAALSLEQRKNLRSPVDPVT